MNNTIIRLMIAMIILDTALVLVILVNCILRPLAVANAF